MRTPCWRMLLALLLWAAPARAAESLSGQVLGGEAQAVAVRTTNGATQSSTVDSLGAFEISNPPTGTIRLEFHFVDGRRIHTDWFVI